MDPNAPWYSVKDFVSSLAALTACYWSAVDRTTNVNGVKLYHVIWSATAPDRVQWYFNNLRVRHSMPTNF